MRPGEFARKFVLEIIQKNLLTTGPRDLTVRLGVFVRRKEKRLTPKRPSHPRPNAS